MDKQGKTFQTQRSLTIVESPVHIMPELSLIQEVLELLLTFIPKRRDGR